MDMEFSLTKKTKVEFGVTLYQIKAEETKNGVNKGDLGGWVEKKENLDMSGNAWVSGNAQVSGDARVYGNAQVYGNAWVYGNARVYGNAQVYGNAWVYGNAQVYGNARVYGDAWVSGNAQVYGKLKISLGYFFGMRFNNEEIKYKKIEEGKELIYKGEAKFDDEEDTLSGKTVEVKIGDKTYTATIN